MKLSSVVRQFLLRHRVSTVQPSKGVLWKGCLENREMCRKTPMQKFLFYTSAWVFSYKFAAWFRNTFLEEYQWSATSVYSLCNFWSNSFGKLAKKLSKYRMTLNSIQYWKTQDV